jgi:hypothetical protein
MSKGEMERVGDKGTRRREDKETKIQLSLYLLFFPCPCPLVPLSPLLLLFPLFR